MIYLPTNTANVTKDRQDIVIEKVENKKIPKHRKRIITRGFIILPRYYQKATLHIISQTLKRQSVLKHLQTDQSFPLVIKTDNVCTRWFVYVGTRPTSAYNSCHKVGSCRKTTERKIRHKNDIKEISKCLVLFPLQPAARLMIHWFNTTEQNVNILLLSFFDININFLLFF